MPRSKKDDSKKPEWKRKKQKKPGRKKKHAGPPPACTPQFANKVARLVEKGASPRSATLEMGIPSSTFGMWQLKARDPNAHPYYRQFFEKLEKARMKLRNRLATDLIENFPDDPKTLQFYLERIFPDEFGKTKNVHVEVRQSVERMIDALEPLMDPDAFANMIQCLGYLQNEGGIALPESNKSPDKGAFIDAEFEPIPAALPLSGSQ